MKIIGLALGRSGSEKPLLKNTDEWEPLPAHIYNDIEKLFYNALPENEEGKILKIKSEQELFEIPEADTYVVFPFGGMHDRWLHIIYSFNKPLVIFTLPFSKVFSYGNVYYPYFIRDSTEIDSIFRLPHKVYVANNIDELKITLRALSVVHRIKRTKVLCIGEPLYEPFHSTDLSYAMVRALQEKYGIKWSYMSSNNFIKSVREFHENVNLYEIKRSAMKIVNLSDERLEFAMRIYLFLKKLIREREINAITINCLFSNILKELNATPCYALSRLNDEGIVAACEADVTTLFNMLIVTYASNSPGFMANPYLFPNDNHILLSHCTSPTLHSFKSKISDDFILYSHFETRKGVSLRVIKKEGSIITITGISHDKLDEMLIIVGKIVKNTTIPTCRTQILISAPNVSEILKNYKGRHWVVVYGDHSEIIKKVNEILGIKSIVIK